MDDGWRWLRRDVHPDCVLTEEAANLDEAVLVHPRLGDDGQYDLMKSRSLCARANR
jgi:hypothetical protein